MTSSYLDSLKLTLSDMYKMSDREYKALSGILLSQGISDKQAFDTGLIQLLCLMSYNQERFPVTMEYLKSLWETRSVTFNFTKMLSSLVKGGYVQLRKYKEDSFASASNITKTGNEISKKGIYIVVTGSTQYNSLLAEFQGALGKKIEQVEESSAKKLPASLKSLIQAMNKGLSGTGASISLESFFADDVTQRVQLNMIISGIDARAFSNKDLLSKTRKYIKGKTFSDFECYKDGDNIFYSVNVPKDIDTASRKTISSGMKDYVNSFSEREESL